MQTSHPYVHSIDESGWPHVASIQSERPVFLCQHSSKCILFLRSIYVPLNVKRNQHSVIDLLGLSALSPLTKSIFLFFFSSLSPVRPKLHLSAMIDRDRFHVEAVNKRKTKARALQAPQMKRRGIISMLQLYTCLLGCGVYMWSGETGVVPQTIPHASCNIKVLLFL